MLRTSTFEISGTDLSKFDAKHHFPDDVLVLFYPIKAIGVAVKLDITLQKYSSDYVSADHGASRDHVPTTILSSHDGGLALKTSKAGVLEVVEEEIDTFILKYLEANME